MTNVLSGSVTQVGRNTGVQLGTVAHAHKPSLGYTVRLCLKREKDRDLRLSYP